MTLTTSTVVPGLLVAVKTSTSGNVKYFREEALPDRRADEGQDVAAWRTERVIEDVAEHERATAARSKTRSLIRSVCIQSSFGLICPESKRAELEAAIEEARKVEAAFNRTAELTQLRFWVLCGRIASDDEEAVKAIGSELTDLLDSMEQGVSSFDVKTIRDAAARAKGLASMLTPGAAARVEEAIQAARAAARDVQAAAKAGNEATLEVDTGAIGIIAATRAVFLDLDTTPQVAAPVAQAVQLDLSDDSLSDEEKARMDAEAADFAAGRDAQLQDGE